MFRRDPDECQGIGDKGTPNRDWRPVPTRIMPSGGMTTPVTPATSVASAKAGIPALLGMDYDSSTGAPILFSVGQAIQFFFPRPGPTLEQWEWDLKYAKCPPPGETWLIPPRPSYPSAKRSVPLAPAVVLAPPVPLVPSVPLLFSGSYVNTVRSISW